MSIVNCELLFGESDIVNTPPLSAAGGRGGGGLEPPTKFSKRGGLTGLQLLEGVAGKEGGDFFLSKTLS